jgi:pimeloyl-ACP methyl ester carboxylesterase
VAEKDFTLPHAVSGERLELQSRAGPLSYYTAGAAQEHPPLLLVHSINAAGSAYEVRPLYEHYRQTRLVYALELPGFGFSDRSEREYVPRLMTDAILAMVDEIRQRHGAVAIDALALSLSSEFLARAAVEMPGSFRSLAFISPTGFDRRAPLTGAPGSTRGKAWLYQLFTFPLWRRSFFRLLTSPASIRYFLRKTWGSKDIDEGLAHYDYLTTHQPGAPNAPYYFVSGYLFSGDITNVYNSLSLPVFMAHGVRGDFVDYSYSGAMSVRPNWTIVVFETGALPHFERPNAVTRDYELFLTRVASIGRDR